MSADYIVYMLDEFLGYFMIRNRDGAERWLEPGLPVTITKVAPGELWFSDDIGPLPVPPEISQLARIGWDVDLSGSEQMVAICARGQWRQPIPILDLPLPQPPRSRADGSGTRVEPEKARRTRQRKTARRNQDTP